MIKQIKDRSGNLVRVDVDENDMVLVNDGNHKYRIPLAQASQYTQDSKEEQQAKRAAHYGTQPIDRKMTMTQASEPAAPAVATGKPVEQKSEPQGKPEFIIDMNKHERWITGEFASEQQDNFDYDKVRVDTKNRIVEYTDY